MHGDNAFIAQHKEMKVSQLIVNGEWNIPAESISFFTLEDLPTIGNGKDKLIWTTDLSGEFSVKSAVQLIRTKYPGVTWEKQVWNSTIHPKISTNLWKILRGACATEENYRKKGFQTVSKYYLYGNRQDTMDHILWYCDFSEKIWHWLGGMFKFVNPLNFMDVLKCVQKKSSAVRDVWYISTFTVMVELWFTRNKICYDEEQPCLETFKQKIMQFTKESSVRMKGKVRGSIYDMSIMSTFGIKGVKVTTCEVKECIFRFLANNQIVL
ncbi:uncharacterized protein LOC113350399 [Papaver somniferum]|uniref:uncharacterized protein LOC113350399 n=1 Tax=Papaver somniferum TaxID=3469 RepID=UPI000E6FAF3D|nr:uncharacterized protein LOC113350399 [Papaver somniferum]